MLIQEYLIFQLHFSEYGSLSFLVDLTIYDSGFVNYFYWLQTRKDGSLMTLSQSKKLSQMTADNAQWEDRQLLRSGAVRGTEVQTEFDDEDERKVILLVHGMFFPCQKFFLAIFCMQH